MPTIWEDFGIAVKQARARKNLTGKELAFQAFGRADRKSHVSQIESGGTRLSARTVEKLAKVLDLPDSVTAPLYRAHLPPEDKIDTDAQRLMQMAAADTAAPKTAEALMIALAYEFAGGRYLDLSTAYTGLRNALQAAAEMRAELDRLHNMDDRLTAVLRRVADLNDRGLREEAGAALDAAIKAKEAELDTLHEAALKQDRLRNRPAEAAKRLIARLRASAPSGGLFLATRRLLVETRERGERQGDPFDLALALDLARANLDRARGPQEGAALNDLGNCHFVLGERQSGGGHLSSARDAFLSALKRTPRQRDPLNWATIQNNLGNALSSLGERAGDPALLQQAVAAHRAALTVHTLQAAPMDWAMTQNNLGAALQSLGNRAGDPALLLEAVDAYRAALTVYTPQAAPMDWAGTQNNLGTVLRTLGDRAGDPALLQQAVAAYRAALTVHTPQAAPMDWAMTQNNLAITFLSLAKLEGDPARLAKAQEALELALTVRTRADAEYLWADSHSGIGHVALVRHGFTKDPADLATARRHFTEAREVFAMDPDNQFARDCDVLIAECDRLQALL